MNQSIIEIIQNKNDLPAFVCFLTLNNLFSDNKSVSLTLNSKKESKNSFVISSSNYYKKI